MRAPAALPILIILVAAATEGQAQNPLSPRMERGRREVVFLAEPGSMPAEHAGPMTTGATYVGAPLRAAMQRLGARRIRRAVPSWEGFRERYSFVRVQQLRRGEQADPGAVTDLSLLFVLELDDSSQVRSAVAALRATPGVLYAHANATVAMSAPFARPFVVRREHQAGFRLFPRAAPAGRMFDLLPSDPDFVNGNNWGFHNNVDQTADVQAPAAWGIQTGNAGVKIGVLDTGIDSTHTDMRSGSAYKVSRQYDFVHNDNHAYPDGSADNPSHGQQAAGITGGHTNDGFGSAGLCGGNGVLSPGCSIIAAKILGDGSWINGIANWLGLESDAADAVIWTANQGSLVQSNSWCHYRGSWGGENYSVHQAMRDVAQVGILTTAAMGNSDGTCNQNAPDESVAPAAFSDIVMAVGAVDRSGNRVVRANLFNWESATGPHISVVAPSPGHFSGRLGNITGPFSGTSAATPFVSGLAGLLWAEIQARGYALYGYDVRRLIELNARDLEVTGWDANTGHGLIDAHRALSALQPPNTLTLNTVGSTTSTCTSLTGWTNWAWWASLTVSVVRRCEVQRTINFPTYLTPPLVWGRPVAGGGVTPSNPNSEVYYTGVVTGSVTTTSAVLKTYVYQRTDGSWWPSAPGNVQFGYAILGQVQPPPTFTVSASTPGFVTQKASYALTGSANAPANNWLWQQSYDGGPYGFWSSNQNSQFVAYGGQYTLGWRLTANRQFDGASGMDEAQTIVCIPSGPGCVPLARRPETGITLAPPDALAAAVQPRIGQVTAPQSLGGIFGSGVWVSLEAPAESAAAMLYSLAGNHDALADPATWPNALRLGAATTRSVADMGLSVVEQVASIRSGTAATIRVTSLNDRADLRVSYAVDPDLGASPHDDRLRWFEGIGVVVVEDAEPGAHAYGWAGTNAARSTLREYGPGAPAPSTRERAFTEQRDASRVLGVRGDVRFVLTLPARTVAASGTTLTFLQTEGPTADAAVQRLLEERDAMLARLGGTSAGASALEVRQYYRQALPGFSRVGAVRASLVGGGATAAEAQRTRTEGITALVMSVAGTGGTGVEVLVLDLRGRVVRRQAFDVAESGTYVFQWDRRDNRGERVVPGLYRAVVRHGGVERRTALVVTN